MFEIGQKVFPIWQKIIKGPCPNCDGIPEKDGFRCMTCDGDGETDQTSRWFVGPPFVISKIIITITKRGPRVMYYDVENLNGLSFADMRHHVLPEGNCCTTLAGAEVMAEERNRENEEAAAESSGGDASGGTAEGTDVHGGNDLRVDTEDEGDGR